MTDLPESARECSSCNGHGAIMGLPGDVDLCPACDGDGVVVPVSPAVEEPGEALRYSPRHVPTLMIHDGEHSGEWVRASNYDAVYEGRRDAHEESRDLSRRLVEAVEEATRLRAETLRQGKRITALDALLVAAEERIERYRELLGKVPPHIMELRDVAGSPSGKETPEP